MARVPGVLLFFSTQTLFKYNHQSAPRRLMRPIRVLRGRAISQNLHVKKGGAKVCSRVLTHQVLLNIYMGAVENEEMDYLTVSCRGGLVQRRRARL